MPTIPKYRDVAEFILKQSGGVMFERYDGTICPVSLNTPASVTRNIIDYEIATDKGMSSIKVGYTPARNIVTGIVLWYRPIIPMNGDGGWMGNRYCYMTQYGVVSTNIADAPRAYDNTVRAHIAHRTIQERRTLTIYCPGIRDDDTAELLLDMVLQWRCRPLTILTMKCTYGVLDLEMWDKVGVTAGTLPSNLTGVFWLITGKRIGTGVGGKRPMVILKLIQLALSNPIASPEWTDVMTGGATKVDKVAGSGGTFYLDVKSIP